MNNCCFFSKQILVSFFFTTATYLSIYGQPTVEADLDQTRLALVCPDLQITAVNWLDESACEALDGQLFLSIADQNATANERYSVQMQKGFKALLLTGLVVRDGQIVLDHLLPGRYEAFQLIRESDGCASPIFSRGCLIEYACEDSADRTGCGTGTIYYSNCDNQTIQINRANLTPNTYIFTDDDYLGCISYVDGNCNIGPSQKVYCADFNLTEPTPGQGHPYGTVVFTRVVGAAAAGYSDLQAEWMNWIACNGRSLGYDQATINHAIWYITGTYNICNTLCSSAVSAITSANVTGVGNRTVFYLSNTAGIQPFFEFNCLTACALTASVATTAANCGAGGTATVTTSGGTGTYQYRLDGQSWQGSNTFSNISPGSHQVEVRNSNGTCTTSPVNFTISNNNGAITGFVLDDVNSTNDIALTNGMVINLDNLPSSFVLTVQTSGAVESVTFSVSGSQTGNHTENMAPYDYPATGATWNIGVGTYTIQATAYSQHNGTGASCDTETITFQILDGIDVPEPTDWVFTCEDGVTVDHYGLGNNGQAVSAVTIPAPGNVYQYAVEIVYKNGSSASSVLVEDAAGNFYSLTQSIPPGTSSGVKVYRGVILGSTSQITYRDNSQANSLQSLMVYAFRNVPVANGNSGTYLSRSGYHDTYTFTIAIPQTFAARDVVVDLPISEITTDCRVLNVTATAGTATQTIQVYQPDAVFGTCCLAVPQFTLNNVPGNITSVTIQVVSPTGSNSSCPVSVNQNGQSYVIAGLALVEAQCVACSDFNPGAIGENQSYCGAFDPAVISGSAAVSHIPVIYQWQYRLGTSGNWLNLSGATGQNYDPGMLTETTQFRRLATTGDCSDVASNTVTITVNDNPNIAFAKTDATCDQSNGTIALSVSGGQSAYTYAWIPNVSTTATANGLAAGTYGVTVTDANGCTGTSTINIQNLSAPLVAAAADQTICVGSPATLSATTSGGTGDVSLNWSPGNLSGNNLVVNPTVTTTYTVTATDASGCATTDQLTVFVDVNKNPVAHAGASLEACAGTEIVLGGTPTGTPPVAEPETGIAGYVWSPTAGLNDPYAANPTVTVGQNTTYEVVVYATTGCTDTATVDVTVLNCGSIGDFVFFDHNGNGIQDSGEPGVPNVTINLYDENLDNLRHTTNTITDGSYGFHDLVPANYQLQFVLPATYAFTAKNAGGDPAKDSDVDPLTGFTGVVSLQSGEENLTIDAGLVQYDLALHLAVHSSTPGPFAQNSQVNYEVTVTNEGGITAMNTTVTDYLPNGLTITGFNDNGTAVINHNNGTYTIPELVSGTSIMFIIETTIDADFQGFVLVNAAEITADDGDDLDSATGNNILAEDDQDEVMITINQTAAITIEKTTNGADADQLPGRIILVNPDNPTIVTWTYTVTNTGTLDLTNVVVTDDQEGLVGTIPGLPAGATQAFTATGIAGWGTYSNLATVVADTPTGGTVTATDPSNYTGTFINVEKTADRTEICAGEEVNFTLTVRLLGGTTGIQLREISVQDANLPEILIPGGLYFDTNSDLNGNGYIDFIDNNNDGISDEEFVWNYSVIYNTSTTNIAMYQAELWYIDPTTGAESFAFDVMNMDEVAITVHSNPQPSIAKIDAACGQDNGSATVSITNGTAPFQYNWSPNVSTTETAAGLAVGTYNLTVQDMNGCTGTASVTINELSGPTITVNADQTVCEDDLVTLTANTAGGTGTLNVVWTPGNLTGNTVQVTASTTQTYTATVTDQRNCSTIAATTITVDPGFVSGISGLSSVCAEEPVEYTATPVTGAVYAWTASGPATTTSSSSETFTTSWTAAGVYTITLAVTRGACVAVYTQDVNISSVVFANAGPDLSICQGGAVQIGLPQGVSAPLGASYAWSPGTGLSNTTVTQPQANSLVTSVYTMTVTLNNCVRTDQVTVIVDPNLNPIADAGEDLLVCAGTVVTLTGNPTGTVAPANPGDAIAGYIWSPLNNVNNPLSLTSSATFTANGAGNYQVIVFANGGCTDTAYVNINIADPIVLTGSSSTDANCNGAANGSVFLVVGGGTGNYVFDWSDLPGGNDLQDRTNLMAETYTVVVSDEGGCSATKVFTIDEPTTLVIDVAGTLLTDASCNGTATGEIDLSISGGTLPYSFDWSNGATTEDISGLAAGTYTVVVTDALTCSDTATFDVTEPDALLIDGAGTVVQAVACSGASTGSITLAVSGGMLDYIFDWSNGASTADLAGLVAGSYTVFVTDANGCTDTATFGVTEASPIVINSALVTPISCDGDDGTITLDVSGGTPDYTFVWSNGQNGAVITGLAAGNYSVSITDVNGCTVMANYSVARTCFDLALIKTPITPAPYFPGSTITYNILVTNQGNIAATAIEITDYIPTGLLLTDGNWTPNGNLATRVLPALAAGQTLPLAITFQVDPAFAGGNIVNYAEISAATNALGLADADSEYDQVNNDAGGLPNSPADDYLQGNGTGAVNSGIAAGDADDHDPALIAVTALVDLSLTKTVDNTAPFVGDQVTYTLTLNNAGPAVATGIVVRDVLPSGLAYLSHSGGNYSAATGLWTVVALGANQSVVLTIQAQVNATGNYLNCAEVQIQGQLDADSTPGNAAVQDEDDSDCVLITPQALIDLSLEKSASVAEATAGDPVSFTITIRNAGPSSATGVSVSEVIPSGFIFEGSLASLGSYNPANGIWTVGILATNGTATLTIDVTVAANGDFCNEAFVATANEQDVDSTSGNGADTNGNGEDDSLDEDDGDVTCIEIPCQVIIAVLDESGCNDNGTPTNPNDDFVNVTLNVTGINVSDTYRLTFRGRTITGTYGEDITLQLAIFGTPNEMVFITASDSGDGACTNGVNIVMPEACSNDGVIIPTINNQYCDDNGTPSNPSDDAYFVVVTVAGVNVGATWTAVDGQGSPTRTGAYNVPVTLGPFRNFGAGSFNVVFTDTESPGCGSHILAVTPLAESCSDACELSIELASQPTCDPNGTPIDPTDDVYYVFVQINGNNASFDGWVTDDEGWPQGSGQYGGNPVEFGPYPIGVNHTIVIQDALDPACEVLVALISPSAYASGCELTIETFPAVCNDNGTPFDSTDDTYTSAIRVIPAGPQYGSGWRYVLGNGVFTVGGPYNVVIPIGPRPIPASGLAEVFQIADISFLSCRTQFTITPPAPCFSLPCAIEIEIVEQIYHDNGTPLNHLDDTYDYIFLITNEGASGDYQLSIFNGPTVNGEYGIPLEVLGVSANTDISVTITDWQDVTCDAQERFFGQAVVGDYTWIDSNGNGVQDNGELPLGNVPVILTGIDLETGLPVERNTLSNAAGRYLFTDLNEGLYKVTFQRPNGYNFTTPNLGDDALDSDASPTMGGMTAQVPVFSSSANVTFDAGFVPDAEPCAVTVTSQVFDCNDEGIATPADDTFFATFTVTGTGTSNCFNYTVNGVTTVGNYQVPVFLFDLPIGNGNVEVVIEDCTTAGCGTTVLLLAPAPCAPVCALSVGTVTTDCIDSEFFTISIPVAAINGSTNGWQATDDLGTVDTGTYGTMFTATYPTSHSGPVVITFTDLADASCTETVTIAVPTDCVDPPVCSISASAQIFACDNQDTPTTADDTFSGFFQVTGTNTSNCFNYTIDGVTRTATYGELLVVGPILGTQGDVMVSIVDCINPDCMVEVRLINPCVEVPDNCTFDCPPDTSSTALGLSCGEVDAIFNNPASLAMTGQPVVTSTACTISEMTFTDTWSSQEGCANGTIVRTFTFRLSTDERVTCTQNIFINDTSAPVVNCAPTNFFDETLGQDILVFPVDAFECAATIEVPYPQVADACGSGWSVETELVTLGGAVLHTIGADELRIIPEVARGDYLLRYSVTDDCGNAAAPVTCRIRVADFAPPTAICVSGVEVSLGTFGISRVATNTIDNGSYDDCGLDRIEIRRAYTRNPLTCDTLLTPIYSDWGTFVDFSCCDAGLYVTVQLRVTDLSGNADTCWTEVLVRDNALPICTGLFNETITCDELPTNFDPTNTTMLAGLFGNPEVIDNCSAEAFELEPVVVLSDCGAGTITRRFYAVDRVGNQSAAIFEQRITIEYTLNYTIRFPQDISTNCVAEIPTAQAFEVGCDAITVSYVDVRLPEEGAECYYVARTYTVTNWCEWNGTDPARVISRDEDCDGVEGEEAVWAIRTPTSAYVDRDAFFNNNIPSIGERGVSCTGTINPRGHWRQVNSTGRWQYTQRIKMFDTTAPAVSFTAVAPFCTDSSACTALVRIPFSVAEYCLPDALEFVLRLDINGNGTTDELLDTQEALLVAGSNYLIQARVPLGAHRMTVQVTDGCRNATTVSIPLQVVDCYIPALTCFSGLQANLLELPAGTDINGDGEMDAAGLLLHANQLASCNLQECSLPLRFSVNRVGEMPDINRESIGLTCADRPSLMLEVYVWDGAYNPLSVQPDGTLGGPNYASCTVEILVADPGAYCQDCDTDEMAIAGEIYTMAMAPVSNVEVKLEAALLQSMLTESAGRYHFEDLPGMTAYLVRPYKNDDTPNGISTLDMIKIQRHLLGNQPITNPYLLIAADVNRSGSVTTLDLIQLRRLILGDITEFANNTSWRFIPADFVFPNATNPWASPFPEFITTGLLEDCMFSQNFIGIKIGDINGSAVSLGIGQQGADRSDRAQWQLLLEDTWMKAGQTYQLILAAPHLDQVSGFQFTLDFVADQLELLDVQPGLLGSEHLGQVLRQRGLLTASWERSAAPAGTRDLFTLVVRARTDGLASEGIRLSSAFTAAEAYDRTQDDQVMNIGLAYLGKTATGMALYQNVPNPVTAQTIIPFELPAAGPAIIEIHDAEGRRVLTISNQFPAGANEVRIRRGQLPPGLYFYTLRFAGQQLSRKMIVAQ